MRSLTFYEFTGVLAPGVTALAGIGWVLGEGGPWLEGAATLGDLGLLLILGYVAGHLVQALGNLIESLWWRGRGGMPSDWARTGVLTWGRQLLSPSQTNQLVVALRDHGLIGKEEELPILTPGDWFAVTRQLYGVVEQSGKVERLEVFNGNYGMFRGLVSSFVLIGAVAGIEGEWGIVIGAGVACLLALTRMERFGKHYSRELFVQYLVTTSVED